MLITCFAINSLIGNASTCSAPSTINNSTQITRTIFIPETKSCSQFDTAKIFISGLCVLYSNDKTKQLPLQAHEVELTLHRRRCGRITSTGRQYDVTWSSCARLDASAGDINSSNSIVFKTPEILVFLRYFIVLLCCRWCS